MGGRIDRGREGGREIPESAGVAGQSSALGREGGRFPSQPVSPGSRPPLANRPMAVQIMSGHQCHIMSPMPRHQRTRADEVPTNSIH
jgi:hypothetical protein